MTPKSAEKNAPQATAPLKKKPSRGKVIAGVVAIAVLVVLLAGAAAYWRLGLGSVGGQAVATTTTTPIVVSPVASSNEGTPSASTETTEAPLSETFTFRNVFRPTVKATYTTATTSSTGTTSTAGTIADTDPDALYLVSTTLTPSRLATIRWNGTTYSLTEGSQVSTSPWRVEAVYSNSALMLYGDTQVTVTVGQSISK